MSAVVVAVIILLVALMIIAGVVGTVLAVQQSQREQARVASQTAQAAAQVFLSASSDPNLVGRTVSLLYLPTSQYMKPVFGCTPLGGHSICMNDTQFKAGSDIYKWKMITLRPNDNIVSFENVELGTWLHAVPDSNVVLADFVDNSDLLTHWKLFPVGGSLEGDRSVVLIQNAVTRQFLIVAHEHGLPLLSSKPYNLNEAEFSWVVERMG